MKSILLIAWGLFLTSISFTSYGQDCLDPTGDWNNQSGSVLTIDSVAPSGLLIGYYTSHEGTEGQQFPVTGWWHKPDLKKDKTTVSFTVYWEPYQTITSWTGYCKSEEKAIHTLWHHIDTDTKYDFQEWSTQASIFKAASP